MRVYLPATTSVLRTLVDEGALPGPHTAFAVPLAVWLLTSFFRQLPRELEDAAILDGANLSDAVGVTKEDLEQQASSLEDAIMPDGSKHD